MPVSPRLSPSPGSRVEWGHHTPEQISEDFAVGRVERPENCVLPLDQVFQGTVNASAPGARDLNTHRASVGGIGPSADQTPALQVVEPVRHRARGDESLGEKLAGR
jgi:hypothetical protein